MVHVVTIGADNALQGGGETENVRQHRGPDQRSIHGRRCRELDRLLHPAPRVRAPDECGAGLRRRRPRQPAAPAERAEELGRQTDARRCPAGARVDGTGSTSSWTTSRREVDRLRAAGLTFRNDIVSGPGGQQILLEDPSGNVVELFQPAPKG